MLCCAAVMAAAGCHNNTQNSGYGIEWVTLGDDPGDFVSYVVTVDSVTLTRSDGAVVTAVSTAESVDFAQLTDFSELWSSAPIPTGTYVSASIVIDYTSAVISVLQNGVPVQATVKGPTGAAVTTVTVLVTFDTANQPNLTPSYATSHAARLAINFHPGSSTSLDLTTSPPAVVVNPWFTAAIAPADTKPIRIRGPLINSSTILGTYSVYVRPFHDEVDNLGTVSIFNTANTIYTIDGVTAAGSAPLTTLSQLSAGITMTAAYTTLTPTVAPASGSPLEPGTAGIFYSNYVIAGSSLEDTVTSRLTGVVTARTGNTLTLADATLSINTGAFTYELPPVVTQVLVDSTTNVTEDGRTTLSPLTSADIAVGQHIEAIGVYSMPTADLVVLDATGASGNNGRVRLQQTQLWGQLVAGSTGALTLNTATIDDLPVAGFNFAGNGATAAQNPVPALFSVNTGTFDAAALAAGTPLWINGIVDAFGAAPPDFTAVAGGVVQEAAEPASLRVIWKAATNTPFTTLSTGYAILNLANAELGSAILRIGPESIDATTLATGPAIVPAATPVPATGTFPSFLPGFALGTSAGGITMYSSFSTYSTALKTEFASAGATYLEAHGTYNRATNTFTANSIDVVF
jgi:hypothetical protein